MAGGVDRGQSVIRALALSLVALLVWPAVAAAQVVVHTIAVTTDSSGDKTAYSRPTFGLVLAVRYVPDPSTPLDTASTVTITDGTTGLQVLAISSLGLTSRDFWPRAFTMTTTGTSALYAAGGQNVLEPVPVAGPIKVVVAAGGATKSGTVYVYVQGR